jgi:hypothetical protein
MNIEKDILWFVLSVIPCVLMLPNIRTFLTRHHEGALTAGGGTRRERP